MRISMDGLKKKNYAREYLQKKNDGYQINNCGNFIKIS